MPFLDVDALRLFRFESLNGFDVTHALLTRRGGVSPPPWHSLNVGGGVGDDLARVVANRLRAFAALGCDPESIHDVWQVHSAEVVRADAPRAGAPLVRADAMVTDRPGVTLFMRFADCVPILLVDPRRRAIGLAHAGWLGTVRKTAAAAVRALIRAYGSRARDLWAGIGPSIAAHHYPVGEEVAEQVRQVFGAEARRHLLERDGRVHFDLWSANRALLEAEGVGTVEVAGLCTACDTQAWYSHRAEGGRTGRFGALLGLGG